jgi:hypothetical protein
MIGSHQVLPFATTEVTTRQVVNAEIAERWYMVGMYNEFGQLQQQQQAQHCAAQPHCMQHQHTGQQQTWHPPGPL